MQRADVVLYLTPSHLLGMSVGRHGVSVEAAFDVNAAGEEAFEAYARALRDVPTALLLDIVEEEYTACTIPLVRGSNRRALIQRKLDQTYGATAYKTFIDQGRAGKREIRILLAALTQPDAVARWLRPLVEHGVPLTTMSSVAFVQQQLFDKLAHVADHVLMVSRQQDEFVRQSLFVHGQLTASRLSRTGDVRANEDAQYVNFVADQLNRSRSYYAQVGIINPAATLDVVWVDTENRQRALEARLEENRQIAVRPADYCARLGRATRLNIDPDRTEAAYAHWAAAIRAPANYAQAPERDASSARVLRRRVNGALWALAPVFLIAAGLAGGSSLASEAASSKLGRNLAELRQAIGTEQGLVVESHLIASDVRRAVQVARLLDSRRVPVGELLAPLGQVLAEHPGIVLDMLEWSRPSPVLAAGKATGAGNLRTVMVSGRIAPIGGPLQGSFDTLDAFIRRLAAASEVREVRPISMPAQIGADATLDREASSQQPDEPARFQLALVMEPRHDV